MLRATLRSLSSHKLRLTLSGLAVVLGVAFVAGTLVFTDTLQKTFDDLFVQTTSDVVVEPPGAGLAQGGDIPTAVVPTLPASVVTTVQGVEGVAVAEGAILVDGVQVVGADGKVLNTQGAPAYGGNWPTNDAVSAFSLTEGKAPTNSNEVVVDSQTAAKAGLTVGGPVTMVTPGPTIEPTVVGIFRFGTTGNLAGASIVAFDTATAQGLLVGSDAFTSIDVKADDGVSQEDLAASVQAAVGPQAVVKTGAQAADEASAQIGEALNFINIFLLVFAGVALFVGTFLILNTFSMLVAQRTRELALLRAVGATRGQVTRSVLGEAFVVGAVGGLLGLALGVALASGLRQIFKQIGLDAGGSLVLQPRTALVAMTLGIVVTVVSAYLPARRASRVPPVAAMRDDATPATRSMRRRTWVGTGLFIIGLAALVLGASASGGRAASLVGLGALVMLVAAIVLAAPLAGPVVRFVGAPFRRSATGRIAVANAARNPRRTAATAAALMIGLALVSAFGVLGASTTASTDALVDDTIKADFLVTGANFRPFSPEATAAVREVDGVGVVSSVRLAPAEINGEVTAVAGVDPATVESAFAIPVTDGSVAALKEGGLLVDDGIAATEGYTVGSSVEVTFTSGPATLPVVGVFTSDAGLNGYVTSLDTLTAAGVPPLDSQVYVVLAPGADTAMVRAGLDAALGPYPNVTIQDQTELKDEIRSQVNQLLFLIYALLALAVLIAILGIINTLVLSVVERTREIGLLRAVGTSRRQLRSMIRIESVVIAVFGALLGIVLGVTFGVALQRSIADQGIEVLSVPWIQLLIFLVVAAGVGVLAALWPARRAARLDVLQAVTTE